MKNLPLSPEERQDMINLYSDFFKDAYGFRPRYDYHSFSDEQLLEDYDTFRRICEEQRIEDEKQLQIDLAKWNDAVEKTINVGAGDRVTALRWLTQNETFYHGQDVEHFVWNLGILFSDEGRKLVKELMDIVTFEPEYSY